MLFFHVVLQQCETVLIAAADASAEINQVCGGRRFNHFCWFEHIGSLISSVNFVEDKISNSACFTYHSLQQTRGMSSKSYECVQE